MFDVNIHRVKKVDGTAITDLFVPTQRVFLTECLANNANPGNAGILITENQPGGAGAITISAQYSQDKADWQIYWTLKDGILVRDSNLNGLQPLSNATKLIKLPFRLANFIRFEILGIMDSKITLDYLSQILI